MTNVIREGGRIDASLANSAVSAVLATTATEAQEHLLGLGAKIPLRADMKETCEKAVRFAVVGVVGAVRYGGSLAVRLQLVLTVSAGFAFLTVYTIKPLIISSCKFYIALFICLGRVSGLFSMFFVISQDLHVMVTLHVCAFIGVFSVFRPLLLAPV